MVTQQIVMSKLHNKKSQTPKRKALRNEPTKAEQILWQHIRKSRLHATKFRRQFGIGSYIVDFCSPRNKLVIELDGDSHFSDEERAYDERRTRFIEANGFCVIRFTNLDVYHDLETILETISLHVKPPLTPP